MKHRSLKSEKHHFLIVLNNFPCGDEIIYLSVITSKVEQRKQRAKYLGFKDETIVELSKDDYPELSMPSAIDCNEPICSTAEDFESSILKKTVMFLQM